MFDIGMTELLVIGIVALIVVGPKDLPGMFRTLGQATGKMRAMARDFQRAMEDAADDSGCATARAPLKWGSRRRKARGRGRRCGSRAERGVSSFNSGPRSPK